MYRSQPTLKRPKIQRRLQGRRSCLIGFIWLCVLAGTGFGIYLTRDELAGLAEQVRQQVLPILATPTTLPVPEYTTIIQDFRRSQQAALKNTLEPILEDILNSVAVYASGQALQQIEDNVQALQSAENWQELTLEKLHDLQVHYDSPTRIRIDVTEVYRSRLYDGASNDRLLNQEHYQVGSRYTVEFEDGFWIVTQLTTDSERVELP